MDNDQTPIIDDENGNNSPRRDWKLYNVIVLGISFMFMFTSFQTCSMAEVYIDLNTILFMNTNNYIIIIFIIIIT